MVLGAGNVAMDSARTAMRLGADRVRIVYRRSREEMPARAAEIHHAEEEGIEFSLLTAPTRFIGNEKGRVKAMECLKMELGEPDASGRRRPVPMEGSKFQMECDLAVIAVGAGANPLLTRSTPGLKLTKWGYIIADPGDGKDDHEGGVGRRGHRHRAGHRHPRHGCGEKGVELHPPVPHVGVVKPEVRDQRSEVSKVS